MVDLKELQKEIDNLLNNITDEELVAWYEKKTGLCVKSYIGEGSYVEPIESTKEIKNFILTIKCSIEIVQGDNFYSGESKLGNAA